MSTPIEIEIKRPRRTNKPDASELLQRIQEQVQEHPYRTLAVAAGLGFALGGGLLSRVTGQLVATGLRLGIAAVVTPLAAQLVDQIRGAHTHNN
jgi:hypothetical protein